MNIQQLTELCEKWSDMGSAIQSQLIDVVLNGEGLDEQNSNALIYIRSFMDEAARFDVDDADLVAEEIDMYLVAGIIE